MNKKITKRLSLLVIVLVLVGASSYGGYIYKGRQSLKEKDELQKNITEKEDRIKDLEEQIESFGEMPKTQPIIKCDFSKLTGFLISKEGNIIVEKPKVYSGVTNSLVVAGKARVFEAQFQARIKDAQGKVLVKKTVTASVGAPEFGIYSATLTFNQVSETQLGLVEVYAISEKDGSEVDLVAVPILLKGK